MIRFSVLVCLSVLLFSTSAMPYKPKVCPDPSCHFEQDEKDENELVKVIQDTIDYDYPNEKMILEIKEVEPLQNMDITDSDIDPDMLIWKAVKGEIQQKYDRPEEDKDALFHSSDIKHPAEAKQPENYFQPLGHDHVRKYDKPEEDRDHLYHGKFGVAEQPMREEKDVIVSNVRPKYSSPEEDKDDLYHADVKGRQSDQQPLPMNTFPVRPKKVHTEPEVDLDDLHHKQ